MSEISRQPAQLHLDPKQLSELTRQMQGDMKFKVLFNHVYQFRESAIQDLCNDVVVGDNNKILAAIGEIRTYNAILTLAGNPIPETEETV